MTTAWKTYDMADQQRHDITLGNALEVFIKRSRNELWIYSQKPKAEKESDQTTADPDWARWALHGLNEQKGDSSTRISVMPSFPDRPLIIRPEHPLRLVSGAEVAVFTRVPVFVSIYEAMSSPHRLITQIPSVRLSNTWFGSMTEGEMCYWLKTRARQFTEEREFLPYLCTCPIRVVNTSDEELLVDKLCLRMNILSIYEQEGRLWSDQMNIIYKGEEKFSDLIAARKPPLQAAGGQLLRPPQKVSSGNIAQRTFKALNQLQPFSVFN